ncbi:unnamed protein product [Rotaria sp. Silwood2]|nr:unnamed protein product [Rotaria sp. Silwood2]
MDQFSDSKSFSNRDECIDYITSDSYDNENRIMKRILLVISKKTADAIVQLICQIEQISCIYIFDDTTDDENDLRREKKYLQHKIRGEYRNQNLLYEKIADDVAHLEQHYLPMTVYPPSNGKETSVHSLDHESTIFLWSHLLIYAITKMHSPKAKFDMLEECRKSYASNSIELRKIDEFERDYVPSKALWWYTRDSFVYRLLNKAFRLKDIDKIYQFRFIISDLVEQLRMLQREDHEISNSSTILSIYRGQYMAMEEIEYLTANIGGLITLNAFTSTSIDSETALSFILDSIDYDGNHAVFFEIQINTKFSLTSPYAKISSVSAMPNECEVLLSIGMILRIDTVKKQQLNDKVYWLVKLNVEKEEILPIQELFQSLKNDIDKEESDLVIFSTILWHMGDYDRAEKYLKMLLNGLEPNNSNLANVYNLLGLIYMSKSLYDEAIDAYNQSIEFRRQSQDENDHIDFAPVYSNLGILYSEKQNHKEAFQFYQKALDLAQKHLSPNHVQMFSYVMNIALAYDNLNDYVNSLTFYKKALEIIVINIKCDHPAIGALYNNIASVYEKLGDYERSLEYQKKAHTIWTTTLPPFHTSIVQSHCNLGTAYASQENYDEALKQFYLALKILETHHSDIHKSVLAASCHNNIGTIYLTRQLFETALIHFEKALEIYKQFKKNESIATIYNNIGTLYSDLGQYSKAMEYYSKSIEYYMLQMPVVDKCSLAQTLDNVGLIQFHFGMFTQALETFRSAFDLVLDLVPSDHPSIIMYGNHVEMTNDQISQ